MKKILLSLCLVVLGCHTTSDPEGNRNDALSSDTDTDMDSDTDADTNVDTGTDTIWTCGTPADTSFDYSPDTDMFDARVSDVVLEEIDRLGFVIEGEARIKAARLPGNLMAGPPWSTITSVCKEVGYNLCPYGGELVRITSIDIAGICQGRKIKIEVILKDDIVACAFIVQRERVSIPGAYSAKNDPSCDY